MTASEGPLTWPIAPNCDAASLGITAPQWADAQARAVEWVWGLSGRFYGTRTCVLRPQALLPSGCCGGLPPYLQTIYGWPFDTDPRLPDPTRQQVLELLRPAVSVTAVEIDGTVMDPSLYRLEGDYLVRQDGDVWPSTQDLISALGQTNTWAVTYERGVEVPAQGQYAASVLACELGKQIVPGAKCRIAFNATTVTRAGVTINRDILMAARTTGVAEVDQWVALVNPNALQREPAVWSPDVARNAWPFAGSSIPAATPPVPIMAPRAGVLVLDIGEPVPPDTPIGTVILRKE